MKKINKRTILESLALLSFCICCIFPLENILHVYTTPTSIDIFLDYLAGNLPACYVYSPGGLSDNVELIKHICDYLLIAICIIGIFAEILLIKNKSILNKKQLMFYQSVSILCFILLIIGEMPVNIMIVQSVSFIVNLLYNLPFITLFGLVMSIGSIFMCPKCGSLRLKSKKFCQKCGYQFKN